MLPVLLAAAAAPAVLAGCTSTVSVAANTYPDVPSGYAQTINLLSAEPVAVWVHGHTELAIVTVGSANCAPIPVAISAKDATTVAIRYVRSPTKPCTADLSPTTNEFTLPDGVDASKDLTVALHFDYDSPLDYTLKLHD